MLSHRRYVLFPSPVTNMPCHIIKRSPTSLTGMTEILCACQSRSTAYGWRVSSWVKSKKDHLQGAGVTRKYALARFAIQRPRDTDSFKWGTGLKMRKSLLHPLLCHWNVLYRLLGLRFLVDPWSVRITSVLMPRPFFNCKNKPQPGHALCAAKLRVSNLCKSISKATSLQRVTVQANFVGTLMRYFGLHLPM